MKVTVIVIVASVFGMVLKGMEKRQGELEIRERIKTTQNTAWLR